MSEKFVALIRGINVGRAKRVAMADLRALVADLGMTGVRTLLNSGNVVFTGAGEVDDVAAGIEEGMTERLGVTARVTAITARDLDRVVTENPIPEHMVDASRFLVAFLREPEDRERLLPLAEEDWAPEKLALGSRAAYLWCPDGSLSSRALEAVGRVLGDAMTTRNWRTVIKLQALAGKS